MRELVKGDLVMLENIEKMIKQVHFVGLSFEEAMSVSQTFNWLQRFKIEINHEIQKKLQEEKVKAALAQAKEVTPEKTESLKDQAPIEQKVEQPKTEAPKAKGKK